MRKIICGIFFILSGMVGAEESAEKVAQEPAKFSTGVFAVWNQGSTVFEIGSKQPDITGFSGGSRITYPRQFSYFGGTMGVVSGRFGADLSLAGTGHYKRSGTARDEDFFLFATSREEEAKVSIQEGKFSDSTNVFSGGRNWADSTGKSDLKEYKIEFHSRWYFSSLADPFQKQNGFYFAGDVNYKVSKYQIYDAVQWNGTSIFRNNPLSFSVTPIGAALSFTHVSGEFPVGIGGSYYLNPQIGLDASFQPLVGLSDSRDFHRLRGITFLMKTGGSGFFYHADVLVIPNDAFLIRAGVTGHRFFERGMVKASGLDPIYNILPPQTMFLNTKEWGARIQAEMRLQ